VYSLSYMYAPHDRPNRVPERRLIPAPTLHRSSTYPNDEHYCNERRVGAGRVSGACYHALGPPYGHEHDCIRTTRKFGSLPPTTSIEIALPLPGSLAQNAGSPSSRGTSLRLVNNYEPVHRGLLPHFEFRAESQELEAAGLTPWQKP